MENLYSTWLQGIHGTACGFQKHTDCAHDTFPAEARALLLELLGEDEGTSTTKSINELLTELLS